MNASRTEGNIGWILMNELWINKIISREKYENFHKFNFPRHISSQEWINPRKKAILFPRLAGEEEMEHKVTLSWNKLRLKKCFESSIWIHSFETVRQSHRRECSFKIEIIQAQNLQPTFPYLCQRHQTEAPLLHQKFSMELDSSRHFIKASFTDYDILVLW